MGTYITVYDDRLDKICYAYYGSTANGQVEAVLVANPGLEEQGILLDAGITITLPDTIVTPSTKVVTQIQLWQ